MSLPSNNGHAAKVSKTPQPDDSRDKNSIEPVKPVTSIPPEFRSETLKLAERIGVILQPVNSACMNHSLQLVQ